MIRMIRRWMARKTPPCRAIGSVRPLWAYQPTMLVPSVWTSEQPLMTLAGEWRANGGCW